MIEVILGFDAVLSENREKYFPRVCGREFGGRWEGWLEFIPQSGAPAIRSSLETTQHKRPDLERWAAQFTPMSLKGALARRLNRPDHRRPIESSALRLH